MTGVQTCALPISLPDPNASAPVPRPNGGVGRPAADEGEGQQEGQQWEEDEVSMQLLSARLSARSLALRALLGCMMVLLHGVHAIVLLGWGRLGCEPTNLSQRPLLDPPTGATDVPGAPSRSPVPLCAAYAAAPVPTCSRGR